MFRLYCCFLLLLLLSVSLSAQDKIEPPLFFQFEQSINAFPGMNPASIAVINDFNFNIGSQIYSGAFSNIQQYYFQGIYRIVSNKNNNNHNTVGLNVQSDHEGDFISRNKWNVLYSWSTKISEQLSISAGTAIGMANYSVEATTSSAGGSDAAFDGHLGVWLWRDDLHIGGSINQISAATLQPIDQTVSFPRYYQLIGGKSFVITQKFKLYTAFINTIVPTYKNQWDIALKGSYKAGLDDKEITLATVFKARKTLVSIMGIENIQLDRVLLKINFSYSYPIAKTAANLKLYEINLNIQLKKKK